MMNPLYVCITKLEMISVVQVNIVAVPHWKRNVVFKGVFLHETEEYSL